MNLFEYDKALTECIDLETGEIDAEKFEALEMEREQKLENLAMWYKDCNAKAGAIKEEEKALKERREAYERKADSLKNYLDSYLAGTKFETAKVRISYRKSERLVIAEDAKIAKKWLKVSTTVDKAGIKAELKAGKKVKGCSLETVNNIGIK